MDFIAILVAGLIGWQNGTFGQRELQVMALVVGGWTAVTTAAQVPYLTVAGMVFDLFQHTVVIAVPYAVGAIAHRGVRSRR